MKVLSDIALGGHEVNGVFLEWDEDDTALMYEWRFRQPRLVHGDIVSMVSADPVDGSAMFETVECSDARIATFRLNSWELELLE